MKSVVVYTCFTCKIRLFYLVGWHCDTKH